MIRPVYALLFTVTPTVDLVGVQVTARPTEKLAPGLAVNFPMGPAFRIVKIIQQNASINVMIRDCVAALDTASYDVAAKLPTALARKISSVIRAGLKPAESIVIWEVQPVTSQPLDDGSDETCVSCGQRSRIPSAELVLASAYGTRMSGQLTGSSIWQEWFPTETESQAAIAKILPAIAHGCCLLCMGRLIRGTVSGSAENLNTLLQLAGIQHDTALTVDAV